MKRYGRVALLVAFLLFCMSSARAQEAQMSQSADVDNSLTIPREHWPGHRKIWPKHWYTDWMWWVGEVFNAGLLATDADSTLVGQSRCPQCQESNPFLGNHPNKSKVITMSSVGFGVFTGLHILMWKGCPDVNRRSRVSRISCNALVPGIGAAMMIPHTIHNYGFRTQTALTPAASPSLQEISFLSFHKPLPPGAGRGIRPPGQFAGCTPNTNPCGAPRPPSPERFPILRPGRFSQQDYASTHTPLIRIGGMTIYAEDIRPR